MRLIALDPGGTTGWAMYDDFSLEHTCGHMGPEEHHNELFNFLENYRPDILIVEDFQYRPLGQKVERMKIELTSVEYIGVAKLYAGGLPALTRLVLQPSSTCNGPRLITDELLKRMGLWIPNMRHAMDAREHLLYYQIVTQNRKELIPRPA